MSSAHSRYSVKSAAAASQMLCGSTVTPVNTTISIRVTPHTNHNLATDDSPRTRPQPNHRDPDQHEMQVRGTAAEYVRDQGVVGYAESDGSAESLSPRPNLDRRCASRNWCSALIDIG